MLGLRLFAFLATVHLVPIHFAIGGDDQESKDAPSAVVSKESCRFIFPIEDIGRTWKWGVADANRCEYSWQVTIETEDSLFQLGFSRFQSGGGPQEGSIDQLILDGQTDLWQVERDGSGASVVEGVQVHCRANKNGLVFELDDEEWTNKLFSHRPMNLRFEAMGTEIPVQRLKGNVEYALDRADKE